MGYARLSGGGAPKYGRLARLSVLFFLLLALLSTVKYLQPHPRLNLKTPKPLHWLSAHEPAAEDFDDCLDSSRPLAGSEVEHHEIQQPINTTLGWPRQIYSSSTLNPPELDIHVYDEVVELAEGFLFLGVEEQDIVPADRKQNGLYIMTDRGQLAWGISIEEEEIEDGITRPSPTEVFGRKVHVANNLQSQIFNGRQVLTVWTTTSRTRTGFGWGQIDILDDAYQRLHTVCPGASLINLPEEFQTEDCRADWHENLITPQGTMLTTAVNLTTADLTALGGNDTSPAYESIAMEIDILTGDVLWSWNSLRSVSPIDSNLQFYPTSPDPYDVLHLNSIEKSRDPVDGTFKYLLSARHTSTVYMVDSTGQLLWKLNGETGGDFGPLPDEARFSWQHDARVHAWDDRHMTISIFNNFNYELSDEPSTSNALFLRLPLPPGSSPVTTVHLLDMGWTGRAAGQTQSLDETGDRYFTFGGGYTPICEEWDRGNMVWSAQIGVRDQTLAYRTYKSRWSALPKAWDPTVKIEGCSGYVSWNGATNVTGWNVYTSEGSLMGRISHKGFETKFSVHSDTKCVQLGALVGEEEVRRSPLACRSQ